MSRALLYSREGLFSLKGGSGLRDGDLLFSQVALSNRGICNLLFAPSVPQPLCLSGSFFFIANPAINEDKSTMNSSVPGRSHCSPSVSDIHLFMYFS